MHPRALVDKLLEGDATVGNSLAHLERWTETRADEISRQAQSVRAGYGPTDQTVHDWATVAAGDQNGSVAQQRSYLFQDMGQAAQVFDMIGQRPIAQACAVGGLGEREFAECEVFGEALFNLHASHFAQRHANEEGQRAQALVTRTVCSDYRGWLNKTVRQVAASPCPKHEDLKWPLRSQRSEARILSVHEHANADLHRDQDLKEKKSNAKPRNHAASFCLRFLRLANRMPVFF